MTALLEMRSITKTFPGVKALDQVNLVVRKGENDIGAIGLMDTPRAAAKLALTRLRETDRVARETVGNHMFDGLADLSPAQRALVAKIMSGNMEKRGKRGERLEKWRERRDERKDGPPEPAPN